MLRAVVLRLFGLTTAAALAVAAVVFLAVAVDRRLPDLQDGIATVATWTDNSLVEPVALASGVVLIGIVLGLILLVGGRRRTPGLEVGKQPTGRSSLDGASLAASVQRSLRAHVHPEITTKLRRGILRVYAPTRDAGNPMELVNEVAESMPGELAQRGVDSVRYRIATGPRAKRRVR